MKGNDQVKIALKDLKFNMKDMGLRVVNSPDTADLVGYFSIGTVRYDPLAGWIADRSYIEFIDKRTNEDVLTVRNDGSFITATVNSHVRGLTKALRKVLH